MKPPLAFLRLLGHIISGYMDDLYLQGKTHQECIANIIDAITLFENLGLVIHPNKSVIVPKQRLVFLGFRFCFNESLPVWVIDSVLMTSLQTRSLLSCLLQHPYSVKIRNVAKVSGRLISSLPGVKYGALYYRNFEMERIAALKSANGNFKDKMCISHKEISELNWWLCNLHSSF